MRRHAKATLVCTIVCFSLLLTACGINRDIRNDASVRQQNAVGNGVHPLANEPASVYGRWGKLGLEETKRHYPNANIVDYQHVKRLASETFRYELRQNGLTFTVHSTITFDPDTNRVIFVDIKRIE